MRNLDKYKGVIPAFYACYDDNGEISPERECIGAVSASSLYRKDEDYIALGEILKKRGLEISKSLGFMP